MNRVLLIGGAAIIGILAAWLAIGSPSTGGDVPELAAPAPAATTKPARTSNALPGAAQGSRATAENAGPPQPASVAMVERRSKPDAMLVGMQSSAWTLIKREIARVDHPQSRAFLDEASDLIRGLREARLNPDAADMANLQARQKDLRARMTAANLGSPVIDSQFDRLDDLDKRYTIDESAPSAP